jgi:hypothetical protein
VCGRMPYMDHAQSSVVELPPTREHRCQIPSRPVREGGRLALQPSPLKATCLQATRGVWIITRAPLSRAACASVHLDGCVWRWCGDYGRDYEEAVDYRLRSITVWGVSLNQTFNPDVFEYSVRVPPTPDDAPEKQWEGDKATYMHRVEGVGGRITLSVTAFRCDRISITRAWTPAHCICHPSLMPASAVGCWLYTCGECPRQWSSTGGVHGAIERERWQTNAGSVVVGLELCRATWLRLRVMGMGGARISVSLTRVGHW